ncbi:MAG: zincin-like metallopeptidase domain-containing protein [Rhodanobacteraceae bacterium]
MPAAWSTFTATLVNSYQRPRLDRTHDKRFGDEAYAAEELIAEFGAAFLCAAVGIEAAPRDDHAAYLAGWIRLLKADPHAFTTAASKAEAAAEYLQHLQAEPQTLTA